MEIDGNKIRLRPAIESDRKSVYEWLARFDATGSMMEAPEYSDPSMPAWEEFCRDYPLSFFSDSGEGKGRNYIIAAGDEDVGTVGYDLLDREKDRVVLDIWMRAEKYCGHGYGSDALDTLCNRIHEIYAISDFIISPPARNKRAIAAYGKVGFEYVKIISKEEQIKEFGMAEYDDNVLMIKVLDNSRSNDCRS